MKITQEDLTDLPDIDLAGQAFLVLSEIKERLAKKGEKGTLLDLYLSDEIDKVIEQLQVLY